MTDLSVNICGVNFKNPIIGASGTYGFGGEMEQFYPNSTMGGISVKGLTLNPRLGNPPPRIAETASGMLNSVGLQNPGIDSFVKDILPAIQDKTNIIANVSGNTIEEYIQMVEKLQNTGVHMIEVNISCPNIHANGMAFGSKAETVLEVTKAVSKVSTKPIIMKLSPNVIDIREAAIAAQEGGADCISLINTLTGLAIDVNKRKPILKNIFGGLSGPAIKPVALRMVYQASQVVSIPVIGMGGIYTGIDAIEFMICGATGIGVGAANMTNPYACVKIIDEMREYLESHNINEIKNIINTLEV